LPAALHPLLDRVDGPQELAAFLALGLQRPAPLLRRHALQQASENFLGAVGPAVGRQAGVTPTSRAVPAQVVDRLRRLGRRGAAAQGGEGGAQRRGHDHRTEPRRTERVWRLIHGFTLGYVAPRD